MIPVTKPYLPPRDRLDHYLSRVYASQRLTNDGPLVRELTERLEDYLGVSNLLLVANGTLAIQIALATLGIKKGRGVTTPFTFPATSSALIWQGVEPRYAEVDPVTLNLDPKAAEKAVNSETRVILPVHTYGNPCDVEGFDALAKRARVPLIYDASHAFGVELNGQSILRWGDASTLSLHATKLFHTAEGGGVVFHDSQNLDAARSIINFGMEDNWPVRIGINAKMSEMHAAMGLAVLEDIDLLIQRRKEICNRYLSRLSGHVDSLLVGMSEGKNGAYMPILLRSNNQRVRVQEYLKSEGVESRAYFYPSLDGLGVYSQEVSAYAQDASARVLCLPVFYELKDQEVDRICRLVTCAISFS